MAPQASVDAPVVPRATDEFYTSQQILAAAAIAATRRVWSGMTVAGGMDASWRRVGPQLVVLTAAAQLSAAQAGAAYVPAAVAELGLPVEVEGEVVPRALVGVAADGRPLDSLLYGAVVRSGQALNAGAAPADALASGRSWLDMVVQTQVADAGRVASGVSIAARPKVTGWVRMLRLPSCARCALLAGRFYRWSTGFQRHPHCFPAGVVVSGPSSQAATRRWYEGELVVLTTASGKELPATGNHPVLTDRGWVPANLLREGDHVVGGVLGKGARPLVVPDEHEMPARIEDVWGAASVMSLLQMPTATEDFHGDGGYGDVDVVLSDCLLRDRLLTSSGQPLGHEAFAVGPEGLGALASLRSKAEAFITGRLASGCVMGGGSLGGALLGAHSGRSGLACGRAVANFHRAVLESLADDAASYAIAAAQAVLAFTGDVSGHDFVYRQQDVSPRWDAPAGPFTMESRGAYAARGEDLRLRLASQVELDRVVEVRRVEWSGHVYNLTSSEGWFNANGLIVSNCDCRMIPANEAIAGDLTTDPGAYFHSLDPAQQDKVFTKAGAQAIRDGADIGQVVNARRGMSYAGQTKTRVNAQGRTVNVTRRVGSATTTTEATTKRAVGGAREPRLMPEECYRRANGDRGKAIELLRSNGFLT